MAAGYVVPPDVNFDAREKFQVPVSLPVSFYTTTSCFGLMYFEDLY